jgi:WD40 repeat protein
MFVLQSEKWHPRLLAFAPDGRTLAAAGLPPEAGPWSIWLWDVPTRRPRSILEWDGGVSCLAVTADGAALAAAGYGSIRLWDLDTGKERWTVPPTRHVRVRGLVPAVDGRSLLAALDDASWLLRGSGIDFRMLDLGTGQADQVMRLPFRSYAQAVAICPAGPRVAVAVGPQARYEVSVYGPNGAPTCIPLPRHTTCRRLTFTPDGRALAIVGKRLLRLWDLNTGQTLTTATENRAITATAFSPDGRTLAAANNDGTVKLFDTATGKERAAFDWRLGRLSGLAFAADGMTAAAAGQRGIVVWDLDV